MRVAGTIAGPIEFPGVAEGVVGVADKPQP